MPVYEYQCDSCGDKFELLQKFSDAPLVVHEKCGGPVHRLLSAPALQFKGSGWYITDYAKSNGTPTKESSSKDGAKDGSSSEKSDGASSTKSDSSTSTPAPAASTSSTSTSDKS
jgi:putative FmdB family regulatory protein